MFRFSIRELMLVTLVVSLGIGWGLDRGRLAYLEVALRRSEKTLQWRVETLKEYIETTHDSTVKTVKMSDRSLRIESSSGPGSFSSVEWPAP